MIASWPALARAAGAPAKPVRAMAASAARRTSAVRARRRDAAAPSVCEDPGTGVGNAVSSEKLRLTASRGPPATLDRRPLGCRAMRVRAAVFLTAAAVSTAAWPAGASGQTARPESYLLAYSDQLNV